MSLLNKRYVLVQQLGKGGMGVVYKAMDTLLGNRFVTVKEMSQKNLSPQEVLHATEAFKREALLLAGLSHQNLPRIYDHFSEDGNSYLVMDFIEGETLTELLEQADGQGLLPEEVLLIGEQLSTVLNYLHTRQPPIIFRDIKPANVMVSASGDHLYLIDFGIARLFKPGQLQDTLAFGTAGYAPPEQYGAQTTERSDIYSLGVTLHQLLTGLDPTQKKTPFYFPPVRTYNPRTPPPLAELITSMVEVDPLRRPESMQCVRQALQRIRQGPQRPATPLPQTSTGITSIASIRNVVVPVRSNVTRGTTLRIYKLHTDGVHTLAWSPDGKYLASGSRDKTVQVWHADTGERVCVYKNHSSYVYGVAWSPDGMRIASSSFGNVHVWDATTGNNALFYREHSLWVYTVAWAPHGSLLASGSAEGEVHVWDAQAGNTLCKYQGYPRPVRSVAWSNAVQSTKLLSACEDTLLYCWDTATEDPPILYQGHQKELSSVAWSPDDTKIASGSRDKTLRIWDAVSGKLLSVCQGHTKAVYAVAWSPDGTCIASASEDRTVRLWDVMTGTTLHMYHEHGKEVYAVAWSPDGTRIASAGEDKMVRVWQVG